MEDMLTSLETYGYVFLFLYSFGGGFVALMGAGVLAFLGHMDLTTAILVAFVANFIGDMFLFYMGRYNKKQVMEYMHKHKRKLALSHILMKKHGSWVVFLQKYVYGIKTLIPLAIGITKYDMKKFAILNVISAAVWALSFGFGSYYFGNALVEFAKIVAQKPWIAPIILIIFSSALWLYLTLATKKK